jgi:hypothetical protein
MQQIAKAQEEMNKKKTENNETIAKACDELRAFNAAPECDTAGELMGTVLQASRLASVGNGSNPMNTQMAQYADQQAMNTLGSIQKGCLQRGSGGDEKSAVSAPGGAGGINPSTFCTGVTAEKGNEYTDLWADGGAKRTCLGFSKLNVSPCSNKLAFIKGIAKGQKVCKDSSGDYYIEKKCNQNVETTTSGGTTSTTPKPDKWINTANGLKKAYDNLYKDQVMDDDTALAAGCYMEDNPPISLGKTYEYVKSYNNYKDSTVELGESIKVAACNGGANGMVGMKGGWADLIGGSATEIGRALGSTRQ